MNTPTFDAGRFRRFETSAHDRLADSYHAFFVPITEHAAEPLLDAAGIGPGARVLDVATGSGVVAAHAAARRASVVGVDISPRMVSLAARLNPSCAFRVADVEALPFDAGSFDAVVCAFGVGHFPHAEVAVAECARVLAPAGRLVLAWWDLPARNRLHGVLLEPIQESGAVPPQNLPPGPSMFRFSDDAELGSLLRSAGLGDISVTSHAFHYGVASADVLWEGAMGSLARTSTLVLGQPAEIQRRIRLGFDRLVAVHAASGRIELPIAFKIARGAKAAVPGIRTHGSGRQADGGL